MEAIAVRFVPANRKENLVRRRVFSFVLALLTVVSLTALPFTAAQAETGAADAVTVLCDANNYPFEWYDKKSGSYRGIDIDILNLISESSGVQFVYSGNDTLKSSWEAMKTGAADMIAGVYVDDRLAEEYHLTASARYTFEDSMAVVRSGSSVRADDALTVAVSASFIGMQEYLHTIHPSWTQVTAGTFDDCLKLVSEGKADMTFIDIVSLQTSSPLFNYQNLSLLSEVTVSLPIFLGIRSDLDPAVVEKINKAIQSLNPSDVQAATISNTAVTSSAFTLRNFIRYHSAAAILILAVLLCALFAAFFLLYRTRTADRAEKVLLDKNRQLESANRAKSEFLSRVSHDMRTPLNGIIGMTHIAREQENPEKTADCLEKIGTSSRFLLGLINDVLDMTRAESGKIELHPEPYPADEFAAYMNAVIVPLCREKNQTLTMDLNTLPDLVPVQDKLRINQIVFNLLSNAVKYTPEGGKIVYRVQEQALPAGKLRMQVEVSDNGVGMSEEFQQVVFESFTQERRNDVAENRGSGLGLAITKNLVTAMGGTISVRSRLGEGSTFTVVLEQDCVPLAPPHSEEASSSDRYKAALAGRHILLCEDHPLNQEIIQALLQEKGAVVELTENGQLGIAAFRNSTVGFFDCVLMDIRMPVLDGYEATRQLRALDRKDAKTVPVVAMTADAFASDVQKCMDAGMNGHISKPIDPDTLYRTLTGLMERQSLRAK